MSKYGEPWRLMKPDDDCPVGGVVRADGYGTSIDIDWLPEYRDEAEMVVNRVNALAGIEFTDPDAIRKVLEAATALYRRECHTLEMDDLEEALSAIQFPE
jgi:hypothetical protein